LLSEQHQLISRLFEERNMKSLRQIFEALVQVKSRQAALRRPGRRRAIALEPLESRNLLSANVRSIDATGNNPVNPDWGSSGENLLRMAPAEYSDAISAPAGSDRASARAISNLLAAQSGDMLNNRDMSAFVYAWGQFLDHDIDLTGSATPVEPLPIPVPSGDPYFDPAATGTQTIGLNRSQYDAATGTAVGNVRQQFNSITAFVDGSQVYGSDPQTAASLRTLSGGRLKTSEGNLLPLDSAGSMFLAGDVRVNENIELTAMQTLFVREHNRLAAQFAAEHPTWTDEQLYQAARRIVIAELQAITYNEFLPALLGAGALPAYRGYNPGVNPDIANEFSTAAFRLGHSLLGSDVEFLDNSGNGVHESVELRDAFFNPLLLQETGIDSIFKYLASYRAQELDTHVVDDVRNFLFGQPGQGGLDLAALNIQRGRDHGLADYNATRVAYGLPAVRTFADITRDVNTQNALRAAYGNVNNIDLWVGGLAEDHVPGASVGALFKRILTDQFVRLRDGDRFWYERDLTGDELARVRDTSLADVIRQNTQTNNLQENVFFFRASISGHVAVMSLRAGAPENSTIGGEAPQGPRQPMANVPVQLVDDAGIVIATTRTRADGSYLFNHLDLGTYRVHILLPRGLALVHSNMHDVSITRGMNISAVDFDVAPLPPLISPTPPPGAPSDQTNPPRIAQQPPANQAPAPPPLGAQPPATPAMMDRPRMTAASAQRMPPPLR
jgi:peroxidase